MLSKCANPNCTEPFLYLHRGKLFRWDTQAFPRNLPEFGVNPAAKKPPSRVEFFWLCAGCAAKMTLIYEKGAGVMVRTIA
jgi:hypothetical protein